MDISSDIGSRRSSRRGTGEFFAIDRRVWAHVCKLGMNAAIAYLVIARGTGGDNRTSKWSVFSIERRTGISRGRAATAIGELERSQVLVRDPASKPGRPKYKITPAHEIPGCEGFPPPALNAGQQHVFDQLKEGWALELECTESERNGGFKRWKTWQPHSVAEELVSLGLAIRDHRGGYYCAVLYDAESAAKPDWIWLPNSLVDGAISEIPPIELVRQTGSASTLRLLVDLYGAQDLEGDGGIHLRRIRVGYTRHKVGERGPYIVWGFVPSTAISWPDAPFVAPHLAGAGGDEDKLKAAWGEFWACWCRLRDLGLVEVVAHLVDNDSNEGEIIHPMALVQ
jgi:hypothetical protein